MKGITKLSTNECKKRYYYMMLKKIISILNVDNFPLMIPEGICDFSFLNIYS